MNNTYIIAISIIIAGALMSGAYVYVNKDGGNPDGGVLGEDKPIVEEEQEESEIGFSDIELEGWPSKGDPDAPVVIVEYSDFACPFCKRFKDETVAHIERDYVEEGKVLLLFKDFPVVGGDRAAEAAHCAGDQDAYWEYHETLFENQTADRSRWSDPEVHRGYADNLGLNSDDLVDCFEERRYRDKVMSSAQEAQALGGEGTPYILINERKVSGAQPYDIVRRMIDIELAN